MVVSNNQYEYARWDRLGQRERLDAGTLQAAVLDAGTLDELERLLAGALGGVIEFRPALRHLPALSLEIGALGEIVRAGIDGEPVALEASLRLGRPRRAAPARARRDARDPGGASAGGRLASRPCFGLLAAPDPGDARGR